jgi:two-component system response regulator (stage 0 sporulation protein A)
MEKTGKFEIVFVAYDGASGLSSILEKAPDVVILDILLPERDGISILEYMRDIKERPVFIMLTAVGQENITRQVLELGANYVILKPFNMDILLKRVLELYSVKNKVSENDFFIEATPKINKDEAITTMLQKIGIPINLKGYNYLKIAASLSLDDPKLLESITKLLYPTIAKECGSTASRVERDIRHSIEVAWGRGKGQYYYDMIGYGGASEEKPTNGAFISTIVEKLRRQLS